MYYDMYHIIKRKYNKCTRMPTYFHLKDPDSALTEYIIMLPAGNIQHTNKWFHLQHIS